MTNKEKLEKALKLIESVDDTDPCINELLKLNLEIDIATLLQRFPENAEAARYEYNETIYQHDL